MPNDRSVVTRSGDVAASLGADGVEALSHALARISAVSEDEMDRSASTSTTPPNAVRSAS